MRTEKIVTIYPTVVKPGLGIHPFMQPDPIYITNDYPSQCSFYLTSLMYFCHGKKYTTELDVTYNGKSVLPDAGEDENSLETFMFSPVDNTHVMVGTTLYVKNVNLIESGTYDVTLRLYEEIDGVLGDCIDEKKCALVSGAPIRM